MMRHGLYFLLLNHRRSLISAALCRQAFNLCSKKLLSDRLRASFMAFSLSLAAGRTGCHGSLGCRLWRWTGFIDVL
jgi:hypothetical protein